MPATRRLSPLGKTYQQLVPQILSGNSVPKLTYDFAVGRPDMTEFPFDLWARLAAKNYRYTPPRNFHLTSAAGYWPLREAIAEHLRIMRSVKCEPHQILITQGTQQALFLIQNMLLSPPDKFWLENPGYGAAFGALATSGAQNIPVPVDNEGLIIAEGITLAPDASLAYVTPSHQYPLGYMLSLTRRMELLEWAYQANAWIIEDDYDSEFQYDGLPLASLQGLDIYQRVIYTGTFSKVLFPTLRIGYMVLPDDLIDTFVAFRSMVDNSPPLASQMILTDFMIEGHFTRHLRRTRKHYAEKRAVFLEACQDYLANKVEYFASSTGMYITLHLPQSIRDKAVVQQARAYDVQVTPLSVYDFSQNAEHNGLVLGYTALEVAHIQEGIQRLALAIEDVASQ